MNDNKIKYILFFVLTIQFILLIIAVLNIVGFDIPVFRQLISFIFLTFIPGFLFLRLLRLHHLDFSVVIITSVGLSLAFIMWVGFFINSIFPLIGIHKPMSIWPLLCTLNVVVLCLTFVLFKIDKGSTIHHINSHQITSPATLFFVFLPVFSVLGTQVLNYYHNNILLLLLIFIIALIPIIMTFTKFIPEEFYPLALTSISISLLLHNSLISNYINGYDIHTEYYFANLVKINSIWDPNIFNSYNAMLSLVMLAPTYSLICGLDLTWVFKIIYPLLFSLIPLGIYIICKRQFNNIIAFLSAFLFMFIMTFYTEMIALARQQIAELFFILILVVIFDKTYNRLQRSILYLIFGASLIVSHYSLSYIFSGLLVALVIILLLLQKIFVFIFRDKSQYPNPSQNTFKNNQIHHLGIITNNISISSTFIILYIVGSLAWYIWQSGSTAFSALILLIAHITDSFITEFASILSSEALWLITTSARSAIHEIAKCLNLIIILFICIGIINSIKHWREKISNAEFFILSLISFVLLVIALPVPYFSSALNTTRLYHINLILLAPFGIIGAAIFFNFLFKKINKNLSFGFISIILSALLLLNSGFIHEVTKDYTFTGSLIQQSIREHGNAKEKTLFYGAYTVEEDVFSSRWLSTHVNVEKNLNVYTTFWAPYQPHVLESYGMIPNTATVPLTESVKDIRKGSYIYLQYLNKAEGIGTQISQKFRRLEIFDIENLDTILDLCDIIYVNKGSEILFLHNN